MRLRRLSCLALPLAVGLPLLAGACAPAAVTAASYGVDGASMVETGKTGADHLASIVTKQDCAMWRTFQNQDICRPREGGRDPYDVNYNAPFRQAGEDGVEYAPPPHAAADAPAASWDPAVYTATANAAAPTSSVPAEQPSSPEAVSAGTAAKANAASAPATTAKSKDRKKTAGRHKTIRKKHAPDRAASAL
ncbi:MAG: hypothetical protein JSR90_05175 [Proteobacteria bacterium]|nr:hypothetical protein [Pseudomonadota bacterium]